MLNQQPSTKEVFGCSKFKYNLYTFSARSALNVYLDEIYSGEKNVVLPIYTCETCIKPFVDHGFNIEYYRINEDLSINEDSLVTELEKIAYNGILYVHSYFGFDTLSKAKPLLKKLRQKNELTIIDDYTQSWLNKKKEIEADIYLCSIRKWLSTPDGGVLSSDTQPLQSKNIKPFCEEQVNEYIEASLLKNRFLENDPSVEKSQFYPLFKHTIEYFEHKEAYALSPISKVIFDTANYDFVINQRIKNAKFLSQNINNNIVEKIFNDIPQGIVPFYYPIYIKNGRRADLQKHLIENNIFCTIHWTPSKIIAERPEIAQIYPNILSLVCDQRYSTDDMTRFVEAINNFK